MMALIAPFLKQLKQSFFYLLYPPHCLHCQEILTHDKIFCSHCTSLIELLDPHDRCPACFRADYQEGMHCIHCTSFPSLYYRTGAAFDYAGPAASLIRKLKYANQPYLAAGAGAFLMAQFHQLDWPLPDAIIPVPMSFTHWLQRGYNQSELLAKELAAFLKVPVWNTLERKSGDHSQAGLSLSQRRALEGKHFQLKPSYSLQDKTLLVIDDVLTTGSTLNKCAETLMGGFPASLYALTFCRALK